MFTKLNELMTLYIDIYIRDIRALLYMKTYIL